MKKILFVSHSLSTFTKPILSTLNRINFKTALFDYARPTIKVRMMGLAKNIGLADREFADKRITDEINIELINRTKQFKPDYLLIFKGKQIKPETIKQIKSKGILTINYFPDYMDQFEWIKMNALYYDYFFDPCEIVVHNLNKLNIKAYYLPFGYNPDLKFNKNVKKYDVVFIGQYAKRRERYFTALKELDFHIWGYEKYWRSSSLYKYFHSEASFSQTRDIIRSAKIAVNVLTGEDDVPTQSVNYRVFEVTGLGTFLLNWYHKPIDEFYIDKKEIVNFRTADEILLKAKYYLKYDKEREKIAYAGWKRTVKDHTWEKRFIKMFKTIKRNSL